MLFQFELLAGHRTVLVSYLSPCLCLCGGIVRQLQAKTVTIPKRWFIPRSKSAMSQKDEEGKREDRPPKRKSLSRTLHPSKKLKDNQKESVPLATTEEVSSLFSPYFETIKTHQIDSKNSSRKFGGIP